MNLTRKRAGLNHLDTYQDPDEFLTELRAERARELAGELHRKYDLVRWDLWYSAVTSYNDFSKLKSNIRECLCGDETVLYSAVECHTHLHMYESFIEL